MTKQESIGFDATATIKRSDFDVGVFVPNVGDEVKLRITTEATVPKADAAGQPVTSSTAAAQATPRRYCLRPTAPTETQRYGLAHSHTARRRDKLHGRQGND